MILRNKYGKIYGGYGILFEKILVLNDPKLARELSVKQLHQFPHRFMFYLGDSNLKHALFFMPANEDWKRVRTTVSPAFTSGKLKNMLSPIERILGNFIRHLEQFSDSGKFFPNFHCCDSNRFEYNFSCDSNS